jgi:hypothetical protein
MDSSLLVGRRLWITSGDSSSERYTDASIGVTIFNCSPPYYLPEIKTHFLCIKRSSGQVVRRITRNDKIGGSIPLWSICNLESPPIGCDPLFLSLVFLTEGTGANSVGRNTGIQYFLGWSYSTRGHVLGRDDHKRPHSPR